MSRWSSGNYLLLTELLWSTWRSIHDKAEQIMEHSTKISAVPQVKAKSIILKLILFLSKDKLQTNVAKFCILSYLVHISYRSWERSPHLYGRMQTACMNSLLELKEGWRRTQTYPCVIPVLALPSVTRSEATLFSHHFGWVQCTWFRITTISWTTQVIWC